MMPPTITVRSATESDLPALLSLLLTSFRQFPLFAFLYAPLDTDLSAAKDTIWFWRRRLLLELLDPGAEIVVAEVEEDPSRKEKPDASARNGQLQRLSSVERESWRMLDWINAQGELSQASRTTPGCLVVGFAIWNVRVGHAAGVAERERLAHRAVDFRTALRVKALNLENYLWGKLYQRRDQDPARYAAYLAAEEELSELFYAHSCYYLDNLCVDFRYQRMGIGGKLLKWGIATAKGKGLGLQTEAGPMGVGLYRKMGFEQVGVWKVKMVGTKSGEDGGEAIMELPVMRRKLDQGKAVDLSGGV